MLAVATTDEQITTTPQATGEGNVTAPNAAAVRRAPTGGVNLKGRQVDPVGVYGSEARSIYEIDDPKVFGKIIAEIKEELGPVGTQVTVHHDYTGMQLTNDDDDSVSLKLSRIAEIKNAGLEVAYVIHRHEIPDAAIFEVEATLIDAFPRLTNIQGAYN